MFEYTYDIVMQTPLGERDGIVHLNIDNNWVDGCLNILGKENAFIGKVSVDGKCILSGSIETIVSTFEYTAEGYMDMKTINLTLYGGEYVFNISGTTLKN